MRIWEANGIIWFDPWWLVFSVVVGPYVVVLVIGTIFVWLRSR